MPIQPGEHRGDIWPRIHSRAWHGGCSRHALACGAALFLRSAAVQQHASEEVFARTPSKPSKPSFAMIGTSASAATGSAHHHPSAALRSNPARTVMERQAHRLDCIASATSARPLRLTRRDCLRMPTAAFDSARRCAPTRFRPDGRRCRCDPPSHRHGVVEYRRRRLTCLHVPSGKATPSAPASATNVARIVVPARIIRG